MYVLKSELNSMPFAIIKNGQNIESIKTAISEEFSFVSLEIGKILLPDWGTAEHFNFVGSDEEGTEIRSTVQITKLAVY